MVVINFVRNPVPCGQRERERERENDRTKGRKTDWQIDKEILLIDRIAEQGNRVKRSPLKICLDRQMYLLVFFNTRVTCLVIYATTPS